MTAITALFWDVGGVVLTNGWDRPARDAAIEAFQLEPEEFLDRHELANPRFELGHISLDEYLHCTVFYRSRAFTLDEFKKFIFAQSRELPASRAVFDAVARSGKYFIASINNEGRELNEHRIAQFDLRRSFAAFFSSYYVGLRKPDEAIYRLALNVTRRAADECIFVDDRPINVEAAGKLGMRAIHFQDAAQLKRDLDAFGVAV